MILLSRVSGPHRGLFLAATIGLFWIHPLQAQSKKEAKLAERCVTKGSIAACNSYIQRFPEGPSLDAVAEVLWEEAVKLDQTKVFRDLVSFAPPGSTLAARAEEEVSFRDLGYGASDIEGFLATYPASEHRAEAIDRLWKTMWRSRDVARLRRFVEQFGDSPHAEEAKKNLMEAEVKAALDGGDLEELRRIKQLYGSEIPTYRLSSIDRRIERLWHEQLKEVPEDAAAHRAFLEEFPSSFYRQEIEARIFASTWSSRISALAMASGEQRLAQWAELMSEVEKDGGFDADLLTRVIGMLNKAWADDPKTLPTLEEPFFDTFAQLEYLPTKAPDDASLAMTQVPINVLSAFQKTRNVLSENGHVFEASMLTHHVGRVAMLILAKKPHGAFGELDTETIQRAAFASQVQRLNEFASGTESVTSYQVSSAGMLALLEGARRTPVLLAGALAEASEDHALYLLDRLGEWARVIEFGDDFKESISATAQANGSSRVRASARRLRQRL